jgi:hypothetical protein
MTHEANAEMTTEPDPGTRPASPPGPPARLQGSSLALAVLVDVAVVAVWFAVAGLVGAWAWNQLVTLPELTKVGNSASMASEELARQVGIDGWFFMIALVGGLVSGVLLTAWRRRDPLLTVALVALGAGFASWLMIHVGRALGPDDPIAKLRALPEGAHASDQLRLHAHGVAWVWPIAAAFGALIYLWVLAKPSGDSG